ncbi:MAG: hypothetical protein IT378_05315 [Sandaracinaceae bacterium]|nr:hypothetical protein [Sandaracinaceae bacterium]
MLAPRVEAESVRIPLEKSAALGEWIRFRWALRDGTSFWEGVGRCKRCEAGASGFEATLTELIFDPRNEAMFERIQLVGGGHTTGTHTPIPPAGAVAAAMAPPPPEPAPRYSATAQELKPKLKAAPPPSSKLSDVLKDVLRPKPRSIPPPAPGAAPTQKHKLDVEASQLAEAAELARKLNLSAPSLARGRWTEDRVLEAALRMGLKSLRGLTERSD